MTNTSRQSYYQQNKSEIKQRSADYYRANRSAVLAAARARYKLNRAAKILQNRDYRLKTKFGISLEFYEEMVGLRGGRCDICGHKSNGRGSLHVDHDHISGKVRGLLCSSCNLALGLFQDEPDRLLAAEKYLRRPK
jgi:hypothetical protein